MHYHLLDTKRLNYGSHTSISSLPSAWERLLDVRGIDDDLDAFLNPTFTTYRQDPSNLPDIDKAIARIEAAIQANEKIMIFGNYDVDGISSSWVIYTFFTRFLGYKNISIRLPHRLMDGYGIKSYHLDEIKQAGVSLVITVDNGITAISEAQHARTIGLDMIITDHHKPLDTIPQAIAVVNPHLSSTMRFREMCGAMVAFKVIHALAARLIDDRTTKDEIFHYLLPIVAIATVADCMPLVDENRLIVKYGLERINARNDKPSYNGIPESLANFLDYLGITGPIDTYHIGFQISPRLNAGGRMMTAYDSLYTLIHTGQKQIEFLQQLDTLNDQRRKIQDTMVKSAEQQIDHSHPIILVGGENFHEGVVGIVAGRLADKYNKPSIVYGINAETGHAVASLRAPHYASIIDMLYEVSDLLERYGGHKAAGGLTIHVDRIPDLHDRCNAYAKVARDHLEKEPRHTVDTILRPHEYTTQTLHAIQALAPFGEGHEEPIFLLQNIVVMSVEKVGKNGSGHMKIRGVYGETDKSSDANIHKPINVQCMFRGLGADCDLITPGMHIDVIGSLQKDEYRGGVYMKCDDWEVSQKSSEPSDG